MIENKNELVSVVIVTYNSAKYVLETLDSIRTQTYDNIELIITDDCSTDNTIYVCEEWLKENKNHFERTLVLLAEKNQGIAANCNKGIKQAQGKYLKMISGDDYISPDYLEKCVPAFLLETDCGMVYTNSFILNEKTHQIINEDSTKYKSGKIFKEFFFLDFWPKGSCTLYKTDIIFEMNLYDESIWVEDYLLVLKIAEKYSIAHVDEYLSYYRLHDSNAGRDSIRLFESQLQTIERFKNYLYFEKRKKIILKNLAQTASRENVNYLIKLFFREKQIYFITMFFKTIIKKNIKNVAKAFYNHH